MTGVHSDAHGLTNVLIGHYWISGRYLPAGGVLAAFEIRPRQGGSYGDTWWSILHGPWQRA